ncbi:HNH endonuclease signature motif containing protein [Rhodobacter capsulatus]|uniref:HNH endonuclease n=1 Tax=Rhodobacter capsulatus TaxID=1061 RepID=A0A1G7MKP3_RHOCA|nr:HNH endonuclease signature motif containing protein [Rhodobacter capsulatus]WER08773.1 HNH endonuclease signature motif containing protein [Rhodobacter capsulatus]SDF62277.1 HNH endonuclease [Rhodobacter capsulatus]
MSDIDSVKALVHKVMQRDFDLVPTASGQGNRVHLEVWTHKATKLPIGLEMGHSTRINFWLVRSDLPRDLPEGVTRTDKEPTGDGWTDAENDGANHNLKSYPQFARRPLTRLGIRSLDDASRVLAAITRGDVAGLVDEAGRKGAARGAFILKINGAVHAPGGICRPKSGTDWEGGTLRMPWSGERASSRSDRAPGDKVAPGDRLYIWAHEDKAYGHGLGLTATAIADRVETGDQDLAIGLRDVALLPRPFGFKILGSRVQDFPMLQRMDEDRGLRAWQMNAAETDAIDRLIQEFGSEFASQQAQAEAAHLPPLERAVMQDRDEIEQAEEDRKTAIVKARPGQQKFRDMAMKHHGGRCVFTGVRVAAALEAAHVIPHTGNPAFEVAENSLVLRRDIHALFDASLIAIDPRSGRLVLSPSLEGSIYAKNLSGKPVDHKLAREALQYQFRRFTAAQAQEGCVEAAG